MACTSPGSYPNSEPVALSSLIKSRRRYPREARHKAVNRFLLYLGVPHRKVAGEDFWTSNRLQLKEIYDYMMDQAREYLHDLHPDKGGDQEECKVFLNNLRSVQESFSFWLPTVKTDLSDSVKFTPIWRIRLDRKAAQARARRRKNRVAFRAQRRAAYARKRAAGWRPDPADAKARSQRYRKRHPIKYRRMTRRYREANHDRVLEWKRDYYWRRGRFLPRKQRKEWKRRARSIPGTQENEKFKKRRRAAYRKNRKKINARRRELRGALPRIRDHKGRYLPRPMAAAA